jgi:hypothetical protein
MRLIRVPAQESGISIILPIRRCQGAEQVTNSSDWFPIYRLKGLQR